MIRKNLAQLLKVAAVKLETDTTKETVAEGIRHWRLRVAAALLPKDATIYTDRNSI